MTENSLRFSDGPTIFDFVVRAWKDIFLSLIQTFFIHYFKFGILMYLGDEKLRDMYQCSWPRHVQLNTTEHG